MLSGTNADIALLNSGTLRSDTLHPKGPFKMKDLMSILPMIDPMVVLKISGNISVYLMYRLYFERAATHMTD